MFSSPPSETRRTFDGIELDPAGLRGVSLSRFRSLLFLLRGLLLPVVRDIGVNMRDKVIDLNSHFFLSFFFWFSFAFFASLSFGFKKYSPLSSCKSTFLGCCGGGNGVYTFFLLFSFSTFSGSNPAAARASPFAAARSFFFAVFSLVLRWRLRKAGRKRSQDSFASLGSLASSRRIMSS